MSTENETIESLAAKVAVLPGAEAKLKRLLDDERRRADAELRDAQERRRQLDDAEIAAAAKRNAAEEAARKKAEDVAAQAHVDARSRRIAKAAEAAVAFIHAAAELGDGVHAIVPYVTRECAGVLGRFEGYWSPQRYASFALQGSNGDPATVDRAIARIRDLDAAAKSEGGEQ